MTTTRSRRHLIAGVLAAAGAAIAYTRLRQWFLCWGATPSEVGAVLPGDDLIEHATLVTTRAITVGAPPGAVWPWLVQMGQDRGGLYSYDWLENLFGLRFHNADRIVPEWQHLEVGDQIRTAPASSGPAAGFTVVALDPGHSIVTVVGDPARVLPAVEAGPLPDGATWAFVLSALGEDRARLTVRLRARFALPAPVAWVVARLLEPVHFVMERKQLLGIDQRATGDRSSAPGAHRPH